MAQQLKICDFTMPEIERFRELCNFTSEEMEFFNLRSRNKSIIEITFAMNISKSKADVLSKKVKSKIVRVL